MGAIFFMKPCVCLLLFWLAAVCTSIEICFSVGSTCGSPYVCYVPDTCYKGDVIAQSGYTNFTSPATFQGMVGVSGASFQVTMLFDGRFVINVYPVSHCDTISGTFSSNNIRVYDCVNIKPFAFAVDNT